MYMYVTDEPIAWWTVCLSAEKNNTEAILEVGVVRTTAAGNVAHVCRRSLLFR